MLRENGRVVRINMAREGRFGQLRSKVIKIDVEAVKCSTAEIMSHQDPTAQLGEIVEKLTLHEPQTPEQILIEVDRLGKSISAHIRSRPQIRRHTTDNKFDLVTQEKLVNILHRGMACQATEENAGSYEDGAAYKIPQLSLIGGDVSVQISRGRREKVKPFTVKFGVKELRGKRGSREYLYVPKSVEDDVNKPQAVLDFEGTGATAPSNLKLFFDKALFAATYLHRAQSAPVRDW